MIRASIVKAGVAESADAADLKSAGAIHVGSIPTPGTRFIFEGPNAKLIIVFHPPLTSKFIAISPY